MEQIIIESLFFFAIECHRQWGCIRKQNRQTPTDRVPLGVHAQKSEESLCFKIVLKTWIHFNLNNFQDSQWKNHVHLSTTCWMYTCTAVRKHGLKKTDLQLQSLSLQLLLKDLLSQMRLSWQNYGIFKEQDLKIFGFTVTI